MKSVESLAEEYAQTFFWTNAKFRTQEELEKLFYCAIKKAVQLYEDGELLKVQP